MKRPTAFRASEIVGEHVRNSAGEELGKIEDLVVDPSTAATYAIVSFAGIFGDSDRLYAIPSSALRPSLSGDHLIFAGDRALIERAPTFHRRNWPDMADPAWTRRVRDYDPVAAAAIPRDRVVVHEEIRRRRPLSWF